MRTMWMSYIPASFLLASCVQTGESALTHDDFMEMLSIRSVPDGSEALRDECACLNSDIRRINGFTDNMKHSRYGAFYMAMGREKVGALQSRADDIGCQVER